MRTTVQQHINLQKSLALTSFGFQNTSFLYWFLLSGHCDLVFNATLQWQFDMTAKVAFLLVR